MQLYVPLIKPVRFALEIRSDAIPMQLRPLTSIRFLFALLVVLFHGLDFLEHSGVTKNWPKAILTVISHGYLGVDFFFVLSGFILAYSYRSRLSQRNDCFGFWWERFARIYPAYLFAFIIFLPTGIYSTWFLGQPRLALVTAAFQLSLTQSWVPAAALEWNAPAWSLSVEAFFYVLFPFLFLTIHMFSKGRLVLFLLAAYMLSQIGALVGILCDVQICLVFLGFQQPLLMSERYFLCIFHFSDCLNLCSEWPLAYCLRRCLPCPQFGVI